MHSWWYISNTSVTKKDLFFQTLFQYIFGSAIIHYFSSIFRHFQRIFDWCQESLSWANKIWIIFYFFLGISNDYFCLRNWIWTLKYPRYQKNSLRIYIWILDSVEFCLTYWEIPQLSPYENQTSFWGWLMIRELTFLRYHYRNQSTVRNKTLIWLLRLIDD